MNYTPRGKVEAQHQLVGWYLAVWEAENNNGTYLGSGRDSEIGRSTLLLVICKCGLNEVEVAVHCSLSGGIRSGDVAEN